MRNGGMVGKRPCRSCRKWFRPHARVGDRQKTCGQPGCVKAWRSKKNREAYRKERDYHRGCALREKLGGDPCQARKEELCKPSGKPTALQLPREEIVSAMGLEAAIVMEYVSHVVLRRMRGSPW